MRTKKILVASAILSVVTLMTLNSCKTTIPPNAVAVKPFFLNKYLGKWYEIARIDFKHEKGLNNVTATYSLNKDGSVKVDNKGYDFEKITWKNSIGKAKFVGDKNEAKLKVSFFGPFYSGYNVIAIDNDYKYALVAGESLDYLWILSRKTTIPDETKEAYLAIATKAGYDVSRLNWIEHNDL